MLGRKSYQFRSHRESLPSARDGYYLGFGVIGEWGDSVTRKYMIAGWLDGESKKVNLKWWRSPELLSEREESRDLRTVLDSQIPECLIINQGE